MIVFWWLSVGLFWQYFSNKLATVCFKYYVQCYFSNGIDILTILTSHQEAVAACISWKGKNLVSPLQFLFLLCMQSQPLYYLCMKTKNTINLDKHMNTIIYIFLILYKLNHLVTIFCTLKIVFLAIINIW